MWSGVIWWAFWLRSTCLKANGGWVFSGGEVGLACSLGKRLATLAKLLIPNALLGAYK